MDTKQVICEVCGQSIDESQYNRHMAHGHKEKQPKKEFICSICNKEFTSKYNFEYHFAHHTNQRNFVCTMCSKAYNTVGDLNQHYKIHEKQGDPFKCEFCDEYFITRNDYKIHLKTHTGTTYTKGPKECEICGKVVKDLKQHHENVHLNVRKHECSKCQKRFHRRKDLDNHIAMIHEKLKNHVCDLCGKAFSAPILLKKHKQRHESGLKTFHCGICKIRADDIKIHFETVHKDLPFSCEHCHRRFRKLRECSKHIKSMHTTVRDWICDLCGKRFAEKYQLKGHFTTHVKENGLTVKEVEKLEPRYIGSDVHKDTHESDSNNRLDDSIYEDNREYDSDNSLDDSYVPKVEIDIKPFIAVSQIKQEPDSTRDDVSLDLPLSQIFIKSEKLSDYEDNMEFNQLFDVDKYLKIEEESQNIPKKSKPEPVKFICDQCGKLYTKKIDLRLHIQGVHTEQGEQCKICGKRYSHRVALYTHVKREHKDGPKHKCDKCPKEYTSSYELKRHFKYHHKPKEETKHTDTMCFECGISFSSKNSVIKHKRLVHNIIDKEFGTRQCYICKENIRKIYFRLKHIAQVHLNGKKLKRVCGYCKAEFDLYVDYKEHIDGHEGVFICVTCGDFFYDKENLKSHEYSHKTIDASLKKYICDHCNHRTFTRCQLEKHMLHHLKIPELNYCDVCGKGFKFPSSLYTHQLLHKEGKFACSYCEKKFPRNSELVAHVRKHTNEKPFKCEICSKGFMLKSALQSHKQTHPETRVKAKCKKCTEQFMDKKQLALHETQFHPEMRPFQCFICESSFKFEHCLKNHNRLKHLRNI